MFHFLIADNQCQYFATFKLLLKNYTSQGRRDLFIWYGHVVFGLNKRFSFKKCKILIEIAKPKITGLYCTRPIHCQLKLNQLPCTDIGYWIVDRRGQMHFEIPKRSVLQYTLIMSLWTTCYAS